MKMRDRVKRARNRAKLSGCVLGRSQPDIPSQAAQVVTHAISTLPIDLRNFIECHHGQLAILDLVKARPELATEILDYELTLWGWSA